jgi:hypothetical protein
MDGNPTISGFPAAASDLNVMRRRRGVPPVSREGTAKPCQRLHEVLPVSVDVLGRRPLTVPGSAHAPDVDQSTAALIMSTYSVLHFVDPFLTLSTTRTWHRGTGPPMVSSRRPGTSPALRKTVRGGAG